MLVLKRARLDEERKLTILPLVLPLVLLALLTPLLPLLQVILTASVLLSVGVGGFTFIENVIGHMVFFILTLMIGSITVTL